MIAMETIRARIKVLMEARGLSVSELSIKSGVSESTIRGILAGNRANMRMDTIEKLCDALGISVATFFKA